jgi:hypothetical protein
MKVLSFKRLILSELKRQKRIRREMAKLCKSSKVFVELRLIDEMA